MAYIHRILGRVTVKIVLIIVLCMLPLNLLSIFTTRKAQDVMFKQTAISVAGMMNQSISLLDSKMIDADTFLFQLLVSDADGIAFSNQKNDLRYLNARHFLSRKLNNNLIYQNSPDVYFFYAPQVEDLILCKKNSLKMARNRFYELLGDSSLLEAYKDWGLLTVDGELFLVRCNKMSGIYFGSFISLENSINEMQENIRYPTCNIRVESEEMPSPSSLFLTTDAQSSVADIYFYADINRKEIISDLPILERNQILLAFLSLLLIPFLFLGLNHILLRPLHKINYSLNRLKSGDKDYRIGNHHQYAEEFLNINKNFNEMADRIEQLKLQKYEYELEWQRVEIRNLQLQIRPHFLLNTFNLIYSLLQFNEKKEAEQVILYLSDYFRYLFRGEEELEPFQRELDLVKKYICVAQIRYPAMLEVSYQIEPAMETVLIPPLLIHNFVENIIRHTLVPGEVRKIQLKAYMDGENAVFVVEDNGPGMPEEIVASINKTDFSKNTDHIGIQNSYQRLFYLYGGEAKMHIGRSDPKGCRITITLNKGGKHAVQAQERKTVR